MFRLASTSHGVRFIWRVAASKEGYWLPEKMKKVIFLVLRIQKKYEGITKET
jgi:hypothetical protein